MTVQCMSRVAAKSKASLEEALNTNPALVNFYDPSIFEGSRGQFTGEDIAKGEKFAVVMDPDRRMRFSTVHRKVDGKFKVS